MQTEEFKSASLVLAHSWVDLLPGLNMPESIQVLPRDGNPGCRWNANEACACFPKPFVHGSVAVQL